MCKEVCFWLFFFLFLNCQQQQKVQQPVVKKWQWLSSRGDCEYSAILDQQVLVSVNLKKREMCSEAECRMWCGNWWRKLMQKEGACGDCCFCIKDAITMLCALGNAQSRRQSASSSSSSLKAVVWGSFASLVLQEHWERVETSAASYVANGHFD